MTALMNTTASARLSPPPRTRYGRFIAAGPGLWRVVDPRGLVIGHIQRIGDGTDARYRARRYRPSRRGFSDLGDFWSAEDAVDCLRFAH